MASNLEMFLGVTQKAHTRAELFRIDCDAAIGKEKGLRRLYYDCPNTGFRVRARRMVPMKRPTCRPFTSGEPPTIRDGNSGAFPRRHAYSEK